MFLPQKHCVTVYFLRDLLAGKRKHFTADKAKKLALPYYDTLSINAMLEFIEAYPKVQEYLPEERDIDRLPRQVSALLM